MAHLLQQLQGSGEGPNAQTRSKAHTRASSFSSASCLEALFRRRRWLLGSTVQVWSTPLPTPRLLSKILSECEDADEIEYLVDGSWCPIRAEKERSCSPQCPILVLGEATHLFLGLVSRPATFLSETRLSQWRQSL